MDDADVVNGTGNGKTAKPESKRFRMNSRADV
jgi:hypothetical protein